MLVTLIGGERAEMKTNVRHMQLEPQVTFKNVDPSDAVLGQIQVHLDKLDRKFAGIRSCRIVFERPQYHNRDGDHFRIDLILTLPGGVEISVNRDAPASRPEEPGEAVEDAFELAEQRVIETLAMRVAGLRRPQASVFEWEQP